MGLSEKTKQHALNTKMNVSKTYGTAVMMKHFILDTD